MSISVRDTLENLGYNVSYDNKSGGVLIKGTNGKDTNIGNEGFKLSDDGRYYTDDINNVYGALAKNNLSTGQGWQGARNYLSASDYIGFNDKTKQLSVNGKDYNIDNKNLVNIGGIVYGKKDYLDSLKSQKTENSYDDLENKVFKSILNSSYKGWNAKNDTSYKNALSDYLKTAKSDMGSRGLISDSLVSHYASQGAAALAPKFAQNDYEKYNKDENTKINLLDKIDKLRNTEISGKEAEEKSQNNKNEFSLSKEKSDTTNNYSKVKMAIERAKALGYVSEQDALILGVDKGELTMTHLNGYKKENGNLRII